MSKYALPLKVCYSPGDGGDRLNPPTDDEWWLEDANGKVVYLDEATSDGPGFLEEIRDALNSRASLLDEAERLKAVEARAAEIEVAAREFADDPVDWGSSLSGGMEVYDCTVNEELQKRLQDALSSSPSAGAARLEAVRRVVEAAKSAYWEVTEWASGGRLDHVERVRSQLEEALQSLDATKGGAGDG